jgi:RNA polymerase sigma-70 factor (ECF subfamily)
MFGKRKKVKDFDIASSAQSEQVTFSDAELLRFFCEGDEKAFEELYSRYRLPLFGYLNRLCANNAAETDEVFEETWLRVIDKAPKYRDDGKFSAWLFRIARNIFIDRLRKNKPELLADADPELLPEEEFTDNSPDKKAGNKDLRDMIDQALATLQVEQREVFLLREEHELSFKEIAEIQQCSLGTVLSRMRYALNKLRNYLTDIDTGGLLK